LERAGDRMVVLGCRDQHRVRTRDCGAQAGDRRVYRLDVVVLVVGRDVAQALPQLELDAGGRVLRCGPQQRGVVRVAAEVVGDGQDARRYAAATSDRSALSVTSLASALVPSGMSAFQLRPNSVRSMVVFSSSP